MERVFKSDFKILKQRHKIYEIENVGHVVFLTKVGGIEFEVCNKN